MIVAVQHRRFRKLAVRLRFLAVAQLVHLLLCVLAQALHERHIHIRQKRRQHEQRQQNAERAPRRRGQVQADVRNADRKRAREQQRRADRREASRRKADRHPEDAHADGQQAAAVHDEQLRRLRDKHRADKDRRPLVKGACA